MGTESERSESVRCVACHEVYEPAGAPARATAGIACPRCGEAGWLAIHVPVEETAATVPS